MIMGGFEFMGDRPFHTVYLHGTVRDTQHVKMSKSLGNGVDPLRVVELYGADALRYTLVSGLGMGADVIIDPKDLEQSFAPGRNFVTKLRNIGKFIVSNLGDDAVASIETIEARRLTRSDQWILARLDVAIAECNAALGPARPSGRSWTQAELRAGLRLSEYAEAARRFVWGELADWYVEATKARLLAGGDDQDVARAVLVHVFDAALRLLQPIVPFVTEELWQQLPGRSADDVLARAAWPTSRASTIGAAGHQRAAEFDLVRDAVVALRQLRSEYAIPAGKVIPAAIIPARGDAARRAFDEEAAIIGRISRCTITITDAAPAGTAAHAVLAGGTEVIVPLEGIIDVERECARLRTELEQLEKQLSSLTQRLGNAGFVSRAPAHVVEAERRKETEWTARREQLRDKVRGLCGS
jgi:valyl-tRNA synthetase